MSTTMLDPNPTDVIIPSSSSSSTPTLAGLVAYPVLRHLDMTGHVPDAAVALIEAAALRLLDSEMIIELRAAMPGAAADASASTPLRHEEAPLTESILLQIEADGLHSHFKPFMRAFIRIMFGLFFTEEQYTRACDCLDSGHNFAFLMSDAGGPTLGAWKTQVKSTESGIALHVAKVWGIEAQRDCMAVIAARLPGVMFPAAYLVWPDAYRQLKRETFGEPFLAGNLQLANVSGDVTVGPNDRLRIGGPTVFNKYLTVVRPYFVRALMAHVTWLANTGRVRLDREHAQLHRFIADAASSQTQLEHYDFRKVQRVLAIKLLSNEFLTSLVKSGAVSRFEDQRDLLAFSKMEGSSYRCYHELRKSLRSHSAVA
ncbi:hypothetical protein PQQ51_15565 [Paraburkholderia xenovorans]|uniref:hypothetical protein n=1 Tax=Paraburkholderia xenovorans TaxID=36873 RepID=UPI0038B7615F